MLVLVDFINPMRFPRAEDLLPAALNAARATARLKRRLARQGVTAIYANDNYGVWRSEFKDLLAACKALPSMRGEIASMLAPADCDLTILKPLHSAFHATPLEYLLREHGARKVIVVGLATDLCIHLTAMDAYMRGFKVRVPRECTAAEDAVSKEAAQQQMPQELKCSIRKSA